MPQYLWIYWVIKGYGNRNCLDINWLSAAVSDPTDEELGMDCLESLTSDQQSAIGTGKKRNNIGKNKNRNKSRETIQKYSVLLM